VGENGTYPHILSSSGGEGRNNAQEGGVTAGTQLDCGIERKVTPKENPAQRKKTPKGSHELAPDE